MRETQPFEELYFSGRALYGDQFDDAAIAEWCHDEEQGYYELAQRENWDTRDEYRALYQFHAFSALGSRWFDTCLVLGCADGSDVGPIASQVGRFVAIEPAQQWWRPDISGVPAEFRQPSPRNDLPLADGSVDLVVTLGVLHHIPNVSHVLREISRILRSAGVLILREPIHTMGDWRRPRRGVTKHERGLPLAWLNKTLEDVGFRTFRRRYCLMPTTERISRLLRLPKPYNRRAIVLLDWAMSDLMSWNLHYHRDTLAKKLAPAQVIMCCDKRC